MDKFTKEQQVQAVYDLKVGYTLGHADIAMLKSMARQLLASMEQEPVAYMHHSGQVVTRGECCDDKIFAICCKVETPLYATPPSPVVPDDLLSMAASAIEDLLEHTDQSTSYYSGVWADVPGKLRAAMLQAGNSPVTPDGLALVPKRLTAENGAKGVLSGEFSETKFINCPECFGDDECETCDGSGRIEITVPVSWTNIKAIWAKGVEHFDAAPQQENV
jgi:hypothetical protein